MRTTSSNRWIWVFAGALPALLATGAGCGDDTSTTTSTTGADGGSGGTGPGPTTGTDATTSTTSAGGGGASSTTTTTTTTTTTSSSTGTGGGQPACGDGVIEGNETCEGADFGGATCESEGFVSGNLACDANCQISTVGCESCGNDVVDGSDECDGADLDDTTCQDRGFDEGTLACSAGCTFDESDCTSASCGDNIINGNDECEAGDLGGATCETEGFTLGGTLDCAANCQFDTAGCLTCGDDVVNGTDVCDGIDLDGATCLTLGHTGGTLACDGACAFDEGGCTDFPLPGAGDVIISELMANPTGVPDATGEWFELQNPSGTTYQLGGCVISSNNNNETFTVMGDLAIAPGEAVVLANSASPGFTPDYVYPSAFVLANSSDLVTVTCGGTEVDTVEYSAALLFTIPSARSLSLDPGSFTAAANDVAANWCNASTTSPNFTSGDQGTPGEVNPVCGGGNLTIDDCRLQFPTAIQEEEGTSVDIFGRVRVDGLTDVNQGGNDPNANLIASVGFGPDGSDPSADPTGWTFLAATPNAAYMTGSPGFEPTYDEYTASFNVPASAGSPYDFAVRFSGDGGATWTYCDTDGSSNGYLAAMAGQMVSDPTSQTFDVFFSEYIERGTGNNKALEIYNIGADVDLGACVVNLYTNGSGNVTNTVTLPSVTLVSGGTFVLCNAGATEILDGNCDLDSNVTNYNGDDAIELVCASTVRDVFGQIGFDPGTGWGVAPENTEDVVLRRECAVLAGDTNGGDAFDPAPEWIGTAYSANAANADLGMHVCP